VFISLDTETTGVDFHHGARVFFVTSCDDRGSVSSWEWDVNPSTRMPVVPADDVEEIRCLIRDADGMVLQNGKFDYRALLHTHPEMIEFWDWDKVEDTLIAAHLLASNQPHNLTDLGIQYLRHDIGPAEEQLHQATEKCRRWCRTRYKAYALAAKGRPDMPSADKSCWKADTWLPRLLHSKDEEIRAEYPHFATVLRDYATTDSEITALLWPVLRGHLERRSLWNIYRTRMKVIPVAVAIEQHGVTGNRRRLQTLDQTYREDVQKFGTACVSVASNRNYKLTLPKGSGVNGSLKEFCYDVLGLEPVYDKKSKTGNPTLNKEAMGFYLSVLETRSAERYFIKSLMAKRKRETSISYMQAYERFWLDVKGKGSDWFVLHPSLNPTGTDTLRWSSSNPNEQNISKQGLYEGDKNTLRYLFGPLPGREWWSLDAKNIELRIPAYKSKEEAFISLFERPDDPPYFGSNHLLIAHILHPREFDACVNDQGVLDGRLFKKRYASTLYQYTKNGNFAVQYGAVNKADGTGTADRAYHVPGGQSLIEQRFHKMTALNRQCIEFARRHGYIETVPDASVDPQHGYPLLCTRTEFGGVKPTVPLNYMVQGTAMWWTMMGMIRTQAILDEWRRTQGFDGHIVMQVHDELVLDFPKSQVPPKDDPERSNLWRIRAIQRLMEQCGTDLGVPTPVGVEYHEHNWSEGVTL
jgi:DNA polymerase I-like protein with 3'-5' exonuclease and polymerase domains